MNLSKTSNDWFLKVCIARLWNVCNKKDEQHPMLLEMLLLDENVTIFFYILHIIQFFYISNF